MPGGYLDPGQGAEGGERLATEAERLDTGQVGEVTLQVSYHHHHRPGCHLTIFIVRGVISQSSQARASSRHHHRPGRHLTINPGQGVISPS